MSDRERWIVYPLLFLALGAALRDKLVKQTRVKQIVCERLVVVDTDGRQQAVLAGNVLSFEPGGPENGLIQANVVNAGNLFQRDRPIATPQTLLSQFLQLLGPRARLPDGLRFRLNPPRGQGPAVVGPDQPAAPEKPAVESIEPPPDA